MDALTLQFVAWVSDRPRTYGEVMEAWTTTSPRMPIWEDAVSEGLGVPNRSFQNCMEMSRIEACSSAGPLKIQFGNNGSPLWRSRSHAAAATPTPC